MMTKQAVEIVDLAVTEKDQFLSTLFIRLQKDGVKTYLQFEKNERIHTARTLLNKRVSGCKNNSETRGLHVQNRPQRCLFLCPNKPKSQKISKV